MDQRPVIGKFWPPGGTAQVRRTCVLGGAAYVRRATFGRPRAYGGREKR